MFGREPSGEIRRRLYEALDRLEKDITSIEILAGALKGFTQPIPDYEPNNDNLLRSKDGDSHERLRDLDLRD
jgi:hypothetical protein